MPVFFLLGSLKKVSKTCQNFTEFYVHVAQCRPWLDLSLSDVSAIFISGSVDDVMFSYTAATARHTDGANAAKMICQWQQRDSVGCSLS